MAYNNRSLSPSSKRIQNPARASDSRLLSDAAADQYRSERHSSYAAPRTSGGVIPLSSETFVSYPPPPADRTSQLRYDSYSGRLVEPLPNRTRGGSFTEAAPRAPASSTTQSSSRNPPRVVQPEYTRPASPPKNTSSKDYYVTPNTTKEPRKETRKVYAVSDGTASLVADVSTPIERHHKRRDSEGLDTDRHRDCGRKGYHLNGPARTSKEKNVNVDDDDVYSYVEPAAMFRDTEPRWRDRDNRHRRNSIDRVGGGSRERPVSMLDPAFDPRRPNRDVGPPPSMRGWDKLNDGIARSSSTRERPRDVPQSPTRGSDRYSQIDSKVPQSPTRARQADVGAYRDAYYVQPRIPQPDERKHIFGGGHDRLEHREPRPQERRNSMTRVPDRSVERRGFGIRDDSRDPYGRMSDESVGRDHGYRDSGYAEPQRRDTAPVLGLYDEQRLEQEKRDRLAAREWQDRGREDDQRRFSRDDERRYNRDEVDRHRERERERLLQPQADHDKHHHRRNSNRERVYDHRKENGPRGSADSVSHPGLSTVAGIAGGAAAATAAYEAGTTYLIKKENRDRDRDRDHDHSLDRKRENDRERSSPQLRPPQENKSQGSRSDDSAKHEPDRHHHYPEDNERGLGFAFEDDYSRSSKAPKQEFEEHGHEDRTQVDSAHPGGDADADYRRRLEAVQRDLGRTSDDQTYESDPDRERRRREREQRQRDRELRNGDASAVGTASTFTESNASYPMPGGYENDSVVESNATTSRPGELRRRRSILDEPMVDEPAQIIDNSLSDKRENRVRIVDPPTEEEVRRPKSILKKPTDKFPDHADGVREGVAPLKDALKDSSGDGIPPGARWTKISRHMVNPEALEEAKERFEEREDFVIVLRVVTKPEIQKLADRTRAIRDKRHEQDRREHRRRDRNRERRDRDEYEDEDSDDEFKPRAPMLLEAPSSSTAAGADQHVMSGGLGSRE